MQCLICRVESHTCALPLEHVVEVMRPLPLERFDDAPPFVLGVSIIRGRPVVVVDAGELLMNRKIDLTRTGTRLVSLLVGSQPAALAGTEIVGTSEIDRANFTPLPGLLAAGSPVVRMLGNLDGALLEVLESARIIERAVLPARSGAS